MTKRGCQRLLTVVFWHRKGCTGSLKRQNRSTILKYSGNTILDVLLNLIPTFGGSLANLKDKGMSYRDSQLFRKLAISIRSW